MSEKTPASTGGRSRRKTAKVVDYSKEQEFSDADIFEDSEEEQPTAVMPKRSRGRPRKRKDAHASDEDGAGYEVEKPVYTEKGYDPSLLPIRERFTFLPEYEPDGSPRIELIVGRRPVDPKEDEPDEDNNEEDGDDDEESPKTRKNKKNASPAKKNPSTIVEYEYLVKYKGRSYLHLEWKLGADLESMNKSAKTLYRRYLKKLTNSPDEDLEDPNFDPSYAEPQKIVDVKEQEITIELTDKELLAWEKKREKALAEEEDDDEEEEKKSDEKSKDVSPTEEKKEVDKAPKEEVEDWTEDEIDFTQLTVDRLRKIVDRDGPYYPVFEGCTNPYRDGYVTEPPKKPRASYLFFQCTMRSYFAKQNPNASQGELMTILGTTWSNMTEEEQAPFIQLAREESAQFDKERAMMERAQKPNQMWQPLRRCRMVLDRIAGDGFASIFLEPVDTTEFTDYEEVIDQPMDLGTIRKKLENKKYQAPEQFARDVRKVWNNCKIYNTHGSAIWHVADYMSKQFERLYHAWVLEFRERYLRWVQPRARPWEHTCRQCDGKCGTPDDKMVLCDHCDAMYGFKCLQPPLKKAPTGIWHCPDCRPKLNSVRGVRMLSAVAEQAARKRAELGDTPKKKIKQTMYLVKWAGLGYEFCTWESRADIGDDKLIASYYGLEDAMSDEPDMSEEILNKLLDSTTHVNMKNAGGVSCIPDLRTQLYAQSRSFQFAKFGVELPQLLANECGPQTSAPICVVNQVSSDEDSTPGPVNSQAVEVAECVSSLGFQIARQDCVRPLQVNPVLPPAMTGEYDAVIPITSKGLMMNVGEIHGSVAFLGYRSFPDGNKGPAELANLIRNVGDKIISVDGVSTVNKSFKEVIHMLRDSGKNKFAYMRFLENKYSVCESDLVSVGIKGRYAVEELQKKFSSDRKRLIVKRKHSIVQAEDQVEEKIGDSDTSINPEADSDAESEDGSEGEFQPDSDDEELVDKQGDTKITEGNASQPPLPGEPQPGVASQGDTVKPDQPPSAGTDATAPSQKPSPDPTANLERTLEPLENAVLQRNETTRSLGFRLLQTDIGYSSDEGGEDDCAFFVDGVDDTFTREKETLEEPTTPEKKKVVNKGASSGDDTTRTVPAKPNDFSLLGDRGKLNAASLLTSREPDPEDFDNFPNPSSKRIREESAKAAEQAPRVGSPEKAVKLSTVKVEQVSVATNEVIHVWASAEAAAATLQINANDIKQVLRGEYDEDLGDEVGGFKWRYAVAGAKVTAGISESSKRGKKGKEAWLEFRDKLYDPLEPHIYKNGNRLRDYQVDGVNWLASTWYKQHGCILADEMGLGKTVQIVAYIEHLFRTEKIHRPYLVVVPLSTVEHWRREFEAWTDLVCCVYHDRQRVWRDVLREYEWYFADRPHTPDYLKFNVLVTTYDTLIGDFDVISQVPWRVAVVDEAHRLRNQKGKLLECMREISAKGTLQYGFQSKVLMSGTPLQNDLNELWTLLNFIEPHKFPDIESFRAKFGDMKNKEQVEALQQRISPFMLRRVKEDVAKDIPAKSETVIDVELTAIQKQYYRAIFEHNHAFLSMGATRSNAPKLMNIQMELRKVCNHPFLLDGVEHRESERQFNEFLEKGSFEGKSPEEQQFMLNEHGYIMTSGKMVLLDKLLPKLREEGHKVLIFSQMVKMLDLISEYCEFRSFPYERLDGRVRGNERQKAIDRFEREKQSFIFLLSTRAGGVGINLTAADTCIIFDSDWNPQNDVQAQARCHRIGQTRDVRIYRLVTSRSFEQEMFDRASKKLGLEQAILGTFNQENDDDKPTSKEMEQLLKKGAYALLEDENDEIGKEFCADDIESILAKRTRTRVVEGTKTASWLNKQGMVVSKSKFTSDSKAADINVDDPLFWQKVMPDFVTPTIMLQKLDELSDEVEGSTSRRRGRGRGRKKQADVTEKTGKGDGDEEASISEEEDRDDEEEEESSGRGNKLQLTRKNQRSVHKYMSDLKSMMEGIFDEVEDDSLPPQEKAACQKLLLTISIKERLFNEDQRHIARVMLKRLEGDRRRRCRTSDASSRFSPDRKSFGRRGDAEMSPEIREELRIVGTKKKRRKRRTREEIERDEQLKKRGKHISEGNEEAEPVVGEDGYLVHSDSEGDWSDVGDDIYKAGKKRQGISRKEAKRRRQWAADDDAATAAGRPWPAFPRHVVSKVLTTVLEEVMKYDKSKGGIFSVPVPKEEFPEYYEQIKQPMDYGTMEEKLKRGDYRSAQAMQKDFILVMQNCLQFNDARSDIVTEARQQALMRPGILRKAAAKHNLFLAEDGSVLELYDDKDVGKKEEGKGRGKRKKTSAGENGEEDIPIPRKKRKAKKPTADESEAGVENDGSGDDVPLSSLKKKKKKLRIRLRMTSNSGQENDETDEKAIKLKVKRKKAETAEEADNDERADDEEESGQKRKRRKTEKLETVTEKEEPERTKNNVKQKRRKRSSSVEEGAGDLQGEDAVSDPVNGSQGENGAADQEGDVKSDGAEDEDMSSIYLNVSMWKRGRELLKDGSFEAASAAFKRKGAWLFPKLLDAEKFSEVALLTLSKMDKHDKYSVFAEAVTEKEAPDYYDIIKNPMDFGKMREKVESGAYGKGSDAAAAFYKDFMLVFENCYLYNDQEGEVVEEAARLLGLLPETYAGACVAIMKKEKK